MLRSRHQSGNHLARRSVAMASLAATACIATILIPAGAAWAVTPTAPVGIQFPLPLAAGPLPDAVSTAVSCSSAGNCSAVGQYQDQIGITQSMATNEVSGSWSATPILAPSNAPDYTFSDLNGVACVSAGNCIGVGDYRISTIQTESYYAVETSGTWARGQELGVPADAGSNPAETTFVSASCTAGGTCQLLGEYLTSSPLGIVHSVVDTYVFGTGITGSPQEISQLAGENGIALSSISCASATSCVAVGAQASSQSETPVYVQETAGTWGTPTPLQNPNDTSPPEEYLSSVSCVAVGDCVAGGDWLSSSGSAYGETYTEQAGVWSTPVAIGEPSNLNNPFIDSVSCVGAVTSCTLVGALTDNQGELRAASAQMTNGHWGQLAPATDPAGAIPNNEFLSVSCTGVQCAAVGYFNTPGTTGGPEAMGASWDPSLPPGPVTGLTGNAVGDSSIHLSWQAPVDTGSGFGHYEVTSALVGGHGSDDGPFAGTSATITSLAPGGTYRMKVTVVATDGQTSTVAEFTVSLPATKPSSVKITRVVGIAGGLKVFWGSPKSTGGSPITSYKVTLNCSGTHRTMHVGGTTHRATFGGLKGNVSCTARVDASNKVGAGPSSAPVTGRTLP
jgi:hypothetical protein